MLLRYRVSLRKPTPQPGPRYRPVCLRGAWAHSERLGHLRRGHPGHDPQRDDFGLTRVKGAQLRECCPQKVQIDLGPGRLIRKHTALEPHTYSLTAATLRGGVLPRVVDEHLLHHSRGDGETLVVRDLGQPRTRDPQARLVDDRRRLECVPPPLGPHHPRGNIAELVVQRPTELIPVRCLFRGRGVAHEVTNPSAALAPDRALDIEDMVPEVSPGVSSTGGPPMRFENMLQKAVSKAGRTLGLYSCQALALLAVAVSTAGCGKSEEQPASPRPGQPQQPAAAQPLKGRDVGKASELVGVWMRTTPGELVGLEFLKSDQVIVTIGQGSRPSAMTLNYSLLEGGRLSLVSGGGATTIYQTTRSKDTLELTPETAGPAARPQRFVKLPSGQTLAEGLRAQAQALDQERLERIEALAALLRQEGLVLRPESGSQSSIEWVAAVAIERGTPEGGAEFDGVLTLDPAPGRDDVLRPVTRHAFRGALSPLDEFTGHIRLRLDIAPAREPAGQEDVRGVIEIISEGSADKPSYRGTLMMNDRFAGTLPATLARDAAAASAVDSKLSAQKAAREAAVRAVVDALGGRIRVRGEKAALGGGGAPEPIEAVIERTPDGQGYTIAADVGARPAQVGQGAVGLVLGRGALYVSLPTGEQWRLQVEEDGSLQGPWRPNPRADFISSGNVSLAIERLWSVAEVEAERAAIAQFMSEGLGTPRRFTGFSVRGRGDDREYHPLTLTLAVSPAGEATGELWSLGTRTGVAVGGRVSGNKVTLAPTGFLPGSEQNRTALQQRLTIELTAAEPTPVFVGQSGAEPLRLELAEAAAGDAASQLALLRGGRFVVRNTSISRRPEPTYLLLDSELQEGGLTGMLVGHNITGSTSNKLPPGIVRIETGEDRGHQILRIMIDSCPQVVRSTESERFEFTGIAWRDEEGLVIQAWDAPQAGNIAWWRMEPVAADIQIEITQEERTRLAAQRIGAVVTAPRSPAVGESVLMLIRAADRDLRVGQFFFADGRYGGSAIAAAAVHAGVAAVDELAVVRITYREPFTAAVGPDQRNGATSSKGTFRPGNQTPSFTLERVQLP